MSLFGKPRADNLSPKASVKLFQFSLTLILGTFHPERVRKFCCSAAYIQGGSESGHSPGLGGLSVTQGFHWCLAPKTGCESVLPLSKTSVVLVHTNCAWKPIVPRAVGHTRQKDQDG